jgi:hypothetical protein
MNLTLFQTQFRLIFYNILAIPSALRLNEVRIQQQSDVRRYNQQRIQITAGYNFWNIEKMKIF